LVHVFWGRDLANVGLETVGPGGLRQGVDGGGSGRFHDPFGGILKDANPLPIPSLKTETPLGEIEELVVLVLGLDRDVNLEAELTAWFHFAIRQGKLAVGSQLLERDGGLESFPLKVWDHGLDSVQDLIIPQYRAPTQLSTNWIRHLFPFAQTCRGRSDEVDPLNPTHRGPREAEQGNAEGEGNQVHS